MILRSKSKKVAVALSGGVDSSVAAALLKQHGYEVIGFHMRLWKARGRSALPQNVKQIGKALAIPIKIFDFKREFKDYIVDYFVDSYKKGITPNPCVVCNAKIKFGLLMKKAKELGCDFLATGHYARLKPQLSIINYQLLRAKDRDKDQTYFLWQLKQSQLKYVVFPLGEIESKQKVRELARQFGLPTFATPESNDVCFLAQTNLQDFLKQSCPGVRPRGAGEIVDIKGQTIGKHSGLWFYTIGQRKGIGLSGGPYFVVAKDIKKNVLIVSQNENDLLNKGLTAEKVNWLSGGEPTNLQNLQAKIRYGAKLAKIKAIQKIGPNKYKIIFNQPQRAITPGQSIVLYRGEELLGGGVIS